MIGVCECMCVWCVRTTHAEWLRIRARWLDNVRASASYCINSENRRNKSGGGGGREKRDERARMLTTSKKKKKKKMYVLIIRSTTELELRTTFFKWKQFSELNEDEYRTDDDYEHTVVWPALLSLVFSSFHFHFHFLRSHLFLLQILCTLLPTT